MGISTQEFAQLCRNAGLDPIEQIRRLELPEGPREKRSKYGVDQSDEGRAARTCDDILFDSKVEMRHYQSLKIAESVGAISDLELQPRFLLQEKFTDAQGKKHRAIYYKADFGFVIVKNGRKTVVDVKGFPTQAWRIKEKMFRAKYPELVLEVWK